MGVGGLPKKAWRRVTVVGCTTTAAFDFVTNFSVSHLASLSRFRSLSLELRVQERPREKRSVAPNRNREKARVTFDTIRAIVDNNLMLMRLRIVGMTRTNAAEARRRARDLLEKLAVIEQMEGGADMVAQSKAIKTVVDQAVVSLVDKEAMRAIQSRIADKIKVWNKSRLSVRTAAISESADRVARHALASNEGTIIAAMDFGADGKLAKKIQEIFKAVHPASSSCIVSMDDDEERLGVYVAISAEHLSRGLSAKDICDACVKAAGAGKGGGKADLANASIPLAGVSMDSVLDTARGLLRV